MTMTILEKLNAVDLGAQMPFGAARCLQIRVPNNLNEYIEARVGSDSRKQAPLIIEMLLRQAIAEEMRRIAKLKRTKICN